MDPNTWTTLYNSRKINISSLNFLQWRQTSEWNSFISFSPRSINLSRHHNPWAFLNTWSYRPAIFLQHTVRQLRYVTKNGQQPFEVDDHLPAAQVAATIVTGYSHPERDLVYIHKSSGHMSFLTTPWSDHPSCVSWFLIQIRRCPPVHRLRPPVDSDKPV